MIYLSGKGTGRVKGKEGALRPFWEDCTDPCIKIQTRKMGSQREGAMPAVLMQRQKIKKQVHIYCAFDIGYWLFQSCHTIHVTKFLNVE